MVNDCQGRGRRYHSSIYCDSPKCRRLRRSFLDADFGMSVGVYQAPVFVFLFFFFFCLSFPNFLLFLSRPSHLHTFHFHFLFVKWRRVHGSPRQRDLEFFMPFCVAYFVGGCANPNVGRFPSYILCILYYAATRILFFN